MPFNARLLMPLAVIFMASACTYIGPGSGYVPSPAASPAPAPKQAAPVAAPATPTARTPSDALQASPRRLVGRVTSVDPTLGQAIVTLTSEPPAAALAEGAELLVRTDALRETARLQASRYLRGRTLGTKIVTGQPSPGDEVVFAAP